MGADSDPGERLRAFLAPRRLLLLLDNFEHLLRAAPLVADLVGAAPGLKVLATSRAPLHLSHEREYPVEPLEAPARNALPPLDDLARTASVALFVARARDAKPAFALTAVNAPAVAEICRRLDGLPLAIELAAARVKLLAPEALLGRLENQLELLTGGARDVPGRQRTMRGAVAWSYDLLVPEERELLDRLSVFAGGFTIEVAEAVCGAEGLDLLDGLGSLVDKSLVRCRDLEDGATRFSMLEVVREFACARLEARGAADEARLAHGRHFLRLVEEAQPHLVGADVAPWLERLVCEHENLRAALALLLARSPAEGMRLAAALWQFWYARSLYTEGRMWHMRALELGAGPAAVRATLLKGLAGFERSLGDPDAAIEHAREAVETVRTADEPRLLVSALNTLGQTYLNNPAYGAKARAAFEEALALALALGDTAIATVILVNLGEVAREAGDYRAARRYYERGREMGGHMRTLGSTGCLSNLGGVSLEEGDYAAASGFYLESLSIAAELGDPFSIATAIDGIAAVAVEAGALEVAARLAGAAEAMYEAVGAPLEPWEQSLRDRYVARLGGALDDERARGRAMGLDDAVAAATGYVAKG